MMLFKLQFTLIYINNIIISKVHKESVSHGYTLYASNTLQKTTINSNSPDRAGCIDYLYYTKCLYVFLLLVAFTIVLLKSYLCAIYNGVWPGMDTLFMYICYMYITVYIYVYALWHNN